MAVNQYGLAIAKQGYSYDDGDNKLVYNSRHPLLKIKAIGSGYITLSAGVYSGTIITHNLGYKPMFIFQIEYINVNTGVKVDRYRPCSWRDYYGVAVWANYTATTTTTTLDLNIYTAYAGNEVLNYNYMVYYDPITI